MLANLKLFRVGRIYAGQRLQNFLKEQKDICLSGKAIKKIIDAYGCKVNGKTEVFSSRKLEEGDQVQIDLSKGCAQKISFIEFVFENEHYLVINKPPGIICDQKILEAYLKRTNLFLVHRLDKDTSGLLLIAKSKKIAETFEDLFRTRNIEKTYLALVDGGVKDFTFEIENFLEKKASYQGQTIWGQSREKGLYALTTFQALKKTKRASLLKCLPFTGRTHQIRVHLSEAGHPILGDGHYTRDRSLHFSAPRTMLHAHRLVFKDPITLEPKEFQIEPPQDFSQLLEQLFS
jgi:RluA family pseudouridine synthase